MIAPLAALVGLWEVGWWYKRCLDRNDLYRRARAHADEIRKPLLVVGAPDRGPTPSPCGDIVLDIGPSSAPVAVQADVTRRIPLPDDSVVAYVCCVLEYVENLESALQELRRVARDRVYIVRVQPWTLTGTLYPGARRSLAHATGNRRA